jgi:hypothetical protein
VGRMIDYGSEGQGFKSLTARHSKPYAEKDFEHFRGCTRELGSAKLWLKCG